MCFVVLYFCHITSISQIKCRSLVSCVLHCDKTVLTFENLPEIYETVSPAAHVFYTFPFAFSIAFSALWQCNTWLRLLYLLNKWHTNNECTQYQFAVFMDNHISQHGHESWAFKVGKGTRGSKPSTFRTLLGHILYLSLQKFPHFHPSCSSALLIRRPKTHPCHLVEWSFTGIFLSLFSLFQSCSSYSYFLKA